MKITIGYEDGQYFFNEIPKEYIGDDFIEVDDRIVALWKAHAIMGRTIYKQLCDLDNMLYEKREKLSNT